MSLGGGRNGSGSQDDGWGTLPLLLAVLSFGALLLWSEVGQRVWPGGHLFMRSLVAVVLDGAGAPRVAPDFEPIVGAGRPEPTAVERASEPPAAVSGGWAKAAPVGAEVCVYRWPPVEPGPSAGYCAEVLSRHAPSERLMVEVTRLVRADPGSLSGDCGVADGVSIGARIWIGLGCLD